MHWEDSQHRQAQVSEGVLRESQGVEVDGKTQGERGACVATSRSGRFRRNRSIRTQVWGWSSWWSTLKIPQDLIEKPSSTDLQYPSVQPCVWVRLGYVKIQTWLWWHRQLVRLCLCQPLCLGKSQGRRKRKGPGPSLKSAAPRSSVQNPSCFGFGDTCVHQMTKK